MKAVDDLTPFPVHDHGFADGISTCQRSASILIVRRR
jgi:hypothetical protein